MNASTIDSFKVGDIFRHYAEHNGIRLFLYDNFETWISIPLKEGVGKIKTDKRKLLDYRLPKNMQDTEIQQKSGNPGNIGVDDFLCTIYPLLFQKDLAKETFDYELSEDDWYVFHVEFSDGRVIAVFVVWDGIGWRLGAHIFDHERPWPANYVFLYFAA